MKNIRRIFAYCARYPWHAAGTMACAIVSTLLLMLVPLLTREVVAAVEVGDPGRRLGWLSLAALGAFFGRDLLNALRIIINNTFEQQVIMDLRTALYGHLQRLPLSWFHDKASGDLLTRVSEDVNNMERVLIDGIEQGSVAVLQILGVSAFLFWLDVELAGWTLAPIPLLVAGVWWYTSAAHKLYRRIRQATSDLNALIMDHLQGLAQIRSFAREGHAGNLFLVKAEALRQETLRLMKTWATYNPGMTFLSATGTVLVLYVGGLRVLTPGSGFAIADLTGFLVAVALLYEPVNRLHGLNQIFQAGRAASERVFRILDEPAELQPGSPQTLPPCAGRARRVEFRGVSFGYDADRTVLQGIDLLAEPGQSIGLVGPTGAGKSTLVGLIPLFYRPTQGQVLIDGLPNTEVGLEALRSQIGVVTQEAFLFNDTVRENLRYGKPEATGEQLQRCLEAANAWEFVKALPQGLDTEVGERGVKLSVGEKQRLSIARALLKDPPILILDEATASVDTRTERLIQEALDRLLQHRTSFLIAHRLSTIRDCGQIIVLQRGSILERGTHENLRGAGGLYSRLCAAQDPHRTIEETLEDLGGRSSNDDAGRPSSTGS